MHTTIIFTQIQPIKFVNNCEVVKMMGDSFVWAHLWVRVCLRERVCVFVGVFVFKNYL